MTTTTTIRTGVDRPQEEEGMDREISQTTTTIRTGVDRPQEEEGMDREISHIIQNRGLIAGIAAINLTGKIIKGKEDQGLVGHRHPSLVHLHRH